MDRRLGIILTFIIASFGLLGYALWSTNIVQIVQTLRSETTKNAPVTRLIAMGDNHSDSSIFHTILDQVKTEQYDGFLHLGDSTEHSTASEFSAISARMSLLPFPTVYAVGNHDIKPDLTRIRFIKAYQQQPCASRDIGHVHIIALDNANRKVGFPEDCLDFLKADLDAHTTEPIIIIYHRPFNLPLSALTGDDETAASRITNTRFLEIISGAKNIQLILSGHLHSYVPYSLGGILAIVSGGGGDPAQAALGGSQKNFFHYLAITVTGNEVSTELHPVQATNAN